MLRQTGKTPLAYSGPLAYTKHLESTIALTMARVRAMSDDAVNAALKRVFSAHAVARDATLRGSTGASVTTLVTNQAGGMRVPEGTKGVGWLLEEAGYMAIINGTGLVRLTSLPVVLLSRCCIVLLCW